MKIESQEKFIIIDVNTGFVACGGFYFTQRMEPQHFQPFNSIEAAKEHVDYLLRHTILYCYNKDYDGHTPLAQRPNLEIRKLRIKYCIGSENHL